MSTRDFSDAQEKYLAKILDGRVTPNSGGTKFSGGDVVVDPVLIEAKTTTTPKKSFSIKKEWIDKINEQAFEQGQSEGILAFQFEPSGENYFVLDENQFIDYLEYVRELGKND